ncbi:MAG: sugar nucleotide-binding protein [Deltaproteobacteria bacterium]|nr:sugar nucleotide-binding protein [Deltaproteobacteria bacterium]
MGILVFGAGLLGQRLARDLPGAFPSTADITDRSAVRQELAAHRPAAVVNAAARTGRPNVDWCETHVLIDLRGAGQCAPGRARHHPAPGP